MIALIVESIGGVLLTGGASFMLWRLVFKAPTLAALPKLLLVMAAVCLLAAQYAGWTAAYVSWQHDAKSGDTSQVFSSLRGYQASRRWRRLRLMLFLAFFALAFLAAGAFSWGRSAS